MYVRKQEIGNAFKYCGDKMFEIWKNGNKKGNNTGKKREIFE